MKKLILILAVLFCITFQAQERRGDIFTYKRKYTLAQRDALSLSLGINDRKKIWVVDTGVNEEQYWDGDSWESPSEGGGPSTDDLDDVVQRGNSTTSSITTRGLRIQQNDLILDSFTGMYELTLVNPTGHSADRTQSFTDADGLLEVYVGEYNATTNTPTLSNSTLQPGAYYKVTTAGTQDFGDGNITFNVGDYVGCDDTEWFKKIDNNQGGSIPNDLTLGVADDTSGSLTIYGDDSDTGGKITIQNPADDDTDINDYSFESINGNLILKANGGTNGSVVPVFTVNDETLQIGTGNYELPREDGTAGQVLTTDGAGNVTFQDVSGEAIPPSKRGKTYAWQPNIDNGTMYISNGGWTQVGSGATLAADFSSTTVYGTWHRRQATGTEVSLYEDDVSIGAIGRGFYYISQFSLPTTSSLTNVQFFGLYGLGAVIGNNDPSGLTDIIGIALDATDTNYQFIYNDASGTATKVDLGSDFDRDQGGNPYSFQLEIYCAEGSSNIQYRIRNLDNALIDTDWQEITTNLPASTVGLFPQFYANIGTGASSSNVLQLGLLEIIRYH